MLTLEKRLSAVNLYEELGSYRAAPELVGCDHKTVKAWLEREEGSTSGAQRQRSTDPYLEVIRAKVDATQGRIKSRALHRMMRAAG